MESQMLVSLNHNGAVFFLRSTIWTADKSRATVFTTESDAIAGLAKAKQFMKAAQFKAARIVQA
jgi:Mg2+/Co2+ transporter CorC